MVGEVTTSPSKIKDFCHLPYKGRQGCGGSLGAGRVCRRCGGGEEVFGTGDPSPTGKTGDWAGLPEVRWWMGDCAATIPPSAHSGRHLPLHKGGKGRCRARGRHWARRKAERWRAINDRPYIRWGKCCGFAGRQLEFVMFVCREAERLPYERTGNVADSPRGCAHR